ncbi:MAG: regulatory protein RecX [Chloroflexaceae bacterium]|nr:regulatory protein RecX [Chloroflexaceae bacterium]
MPEGKITALRKQEHDPQRVNVFIENTFAIGISLTTLTRESLYIGKLIDAAAWARLEASEHHDKAFQAALRYLQSRPRSTAEVRLKLQQKQFAAPVIDAAIARLTELELLNDEAFARFWVENRQTHRPRGVALVRTELLRKGIDRTIIDHTMADEDLHGDDSERALALARGVLRKYQDAPDRAAFQRRLGGYLQRRGFLFATIRPILDELWHEVQQTGVDEAEDREE